VAVEKVLGGGTNLAINRRLAKWRPMMAHKRTAYTAIFPMHNAAEKQWDNGGNLGISMCVGCKEHLVPVTTEAESAYSSAPAALETLLITPGKPSRQTATKQRGWKIIKKKSPQKKNKRRGCEKAARQK